MGGILIQGFTDTEVFIKMLLCLSFGICLLSSIMADCWGVGLEWVGPRD